MIHCPYHMETTSDVKNGRLHCPACLRVYESRDMHVLLREKSRRILHTTCLKCGLSLFLSVEANPFGMVGVGVPTDLSYAEAAQRGTADPITVDRVIEVYRELQDREKKSK